MSNKGVDPKTTRAKLVHARSGWDDVLRAVLVMENEDGVEVKVAEFTLTKDFGMRCAKAAAEAIKKEYSSA